MKRDKKSERHEAEQRVLQLEDEIEFQKERFLAASRGGIHAVKTDLSALSWMRNYPREAAILIMVGGFMAARVLRAKRQASRYGAPQEVG